MKLGARLLVLVLIAALPILALQVHALLQDRAERKAAIAEQALNLARLAAAQQDQFIEAARYLLAAAAQFPEVQERDPAGCGRRMAELIGQFPTVSGLGAVAPDGVQFCSSTGSGAGISVADRPYFQQALRDKSLAISGYIIGRLTGKPHLNFAYPALDGAGAVRAVVILAFSLDRLSASLSMTTLPADAAMSLIDGDGILLARAPPAPEWIGRRVREVPFTQAMVARREGVMEATGIDGRERMQGYAPLFASADLFAVVGLPWQEAYRQADRLFWRETLLTVLAFALAAIVALISGEIWIRRPIAVLQAAVGRIQRGDLSARAGPSRGSSPELRELARDLDDMASTLERRQAALEASEARFRAVVETAADGIITIDERGIVQSVNPAAERLFDHARDEMVGHNVSQLMPAPDRERHDQYLARYLRTGQARIIGIGREVTGQRKDGSTLPLYLSIGELRQDGRRFFTGILRDITDRKRWEQHQVLLMAEIDHRAKNLLAAIQAMVLLTKPNAGSIGDYADTLIGRLHAMARAHDLLARDKWQGARLGELIRAEFAAYVGADSHAVEITGDDVLLRPRAAQTLSLALHELTTNAAKYGALSVPQGRVAIHSSIEPSPSGRSLLLRWTEAGGPEVAPPGRRGFGSVVIERSIHHELDGESSLEFDRDGVRCAIRVPLS
jgi:PAS domain S-box-containing protein